MEDDVKKFTENVNKSIKSIQEKQEELAGQIKETASVKTLEEAQDQLKELGEKMKVDGKDMPEYVKELQKQNDQLETRLKDIAEQKQQHKSQGDLIQESLKEAMKENGVEGFLNKATNGEGLEIKASTITGANSFTETYYEAIPQAQRIPGIQQAPMPMPTVFNLMNPGVTNSRYIPYVERTGYTSAAAMVDEDSAGGQGDVSFEDKQAQVKKISVYQKVSRDSLDDVDYLRSEIQRIMNHDIVQKRENQILTGTGASDNLKGLINASDPIAKSFSLPSGVDTIVEPSIASLLNAAKTQVNLGLDNNFETGYMPNGIVVHPTVLTNLMNETASDGHYRRHPLLSPDGTRLAGIPIIQSKFIDQDTYMIGDFTQARPYVRRNMTLRVLDQNGTDGLAERLTFVLTYRIAFFVPSPHDYAFVYGSIDSGLEQLTKVSG